MAAVNWEVCPTEDVINALMETLVDPRLPRASSNEPPSEDAQESVAKQMHAVVLLFNYYHRKQNLGLQFLGFRAFCRLAELLRPSLSLFMKFTKEIEPVELNDEDNQLSVTEKAIKISCNIAMSLDAYKDVPDIEGHPISKVALFLIDSKKENCFLKYGTITEGVWSLVEKEINESSISLEIPAEQKVGKKRKTDNGQTFAYDNKLLQIAYEAVKDATGIPSSDLEVLEAHIVHSLSKKMSAAQFFMMQYSGSFDIKHSVPIKELVESLQGPLAEKNGSSWSTTKLIEFHHVLPYVDYISGWLSRKDLGSPLLKGDEAQITNNYDKRELPESKNLGQVETNWSGLKSSSADKVLNECGEKYQNKRKHSSAGNIASTVNVVQSTKEHGNVINDFKDIRDLLTDKKGSKISFKKSDNHSEALERGYLSDPSRERSQITVKDTNDIPRECVGPRTRSSLKGKEGKSVTPPVTTTKAPVRTRRKNAPSPQRGIHWAKDHVNLMVGTAEPSKSNGMQHRDEMTADYGDANISHDQSGIAVKENPVPESETLNNIAVENAMDSATLKNATASPDLRKPDHGLGRYERMTADNPAAKQNPSSKHEALHNTGVEMGMLSATEKSTVALLDKMSQDLSSQIRGTLDKQAVCEFIAAQIRRGGEFDLASRCLSHIISGNVHLMLKEIQVQDKGHRPVKDRNYPQSQTRTRLMLPGKSSYRDLELICHNNTLGLPRYTIFSSDIHPGKFLAEVTVQINGFMLRSMSGPETSPDEARESCAALMISRMSENFS